LISKDELLKLHKLEHKRINEAAKMTKDAGMYCNDLVLPSSPSPFPEQFNGQFIADVRYLKKTF